MDSATTPTQLAAHRVFVYHELAAHRVFVYHEPDNRTEYVSPDAVSLADARTEIARYDWNRRARVHLTPDPSGTYIAGPAPQVADLIAHLMDGPPAALGASDE